ncbi:MAG: hypothetical protein K2N47_04890, partial [Clostridia bacterium]|nr:hypothetical protein [Clostridia bacterium]
MAFAFTACNKDTEPDPVKYTVTYAAGGAAGTAPASGEYAAGETFSLPQATGLSKEDCVFG